MFRLPHALPNLNAYAERFIQTIQVECLDRFIVLGLRHLDHLVSEFIEYYNRRRPHSGIKFRAPIGPDPPEAERTVPLGRVRCHERLGGVIKHYARDAA